MDAAAQPGFPRATAGLEWSEMDGGLAVYDPAADQVTFLNASGALVLELCNGRHTPAEIVSIVQAAWKLPAPPEEDVLSLIDRAEQAGLLDWAEGPAGGD